MTFNLQDWHRILDLLPDAAERLVTGIPGDSPDLLDAAHQRGWRALVTRDQRSAAYATAGWSRITGRAAVLLLQAGPSYLTALVAISEISSLRQPLVVLAMDSPVAGVNRGGFQQLDPMAFRGDLFVWTHRVTRSEDLGWALRRAVDVSEGPLGGPTLLLLPEELVLPSEPVRQPTDTHISSLPTAPSVVSQSPGDCTISGTVLEKVTDRLKRARRIVMVLGSGARRSLPTSEAEELARRTAATVLVTASGRGAYRESRPEFAGLAGLYASSTALKQLRRADLVLALGTALEETVRMGWRLSENGHVIHVDQDPQVLGRAFPGSTGLLGDVSSAVSLLIRCLPQRGESHPPVEIDHEDASLSETGLTAPLFWRGLQGALEEYGKPMVLTQENGLCDLWGYHVPAFRRPDHLDCITPGEQTAMGFGLGASLGAALGERRVVSVAGDVALECHVSSILVAADRGLDILFIELRNRRFGWPALSRDVPGITALDGPRDYPAFFAAAGLRTGRTSDPADLQPLLRAFLSHDGPRFLEIDITGTSILPGAVET